MSRGPVSSDRIPPSRDRALALVLAAAVAALIVVGVLIIVVT